MCKFCNYSEDQHSCGIKIIDRKHNNYACTRPKGHTDNHVACGMVDHNIYNWEQKKGE